jgi:hypothetical protein
VCAGVVDLHSFELLEKAAQRGDRGEPDVGVGRGGISCEIGCVVHPVNIG